LRQFDDFAVASTARSAAEKLIQSINEKMRIPIKHLGQITRFNGVDIHQTKHYIKLTCETYLTKMLRNHNWLLPHAVNQPVPLPADNAYIHTLETAIPPKTTREQEDLKQQYYNYRQVIGEVIYPTMKCRPDITEGIYYWRNTPHPDLPEAPLPRTHSDNHTLQVHPHSYLPTLFGYVDSNWATDTAHRKSVTGIALLFAGGAVGYKCKYQDTIAHSSTEAEFVAACDAGKMILFFCSLLNDLGFDQPHATILYEDNNGALMMANAQQPTCQTRHLDVKHFALLDWVEQDLILLKTITTYDNAADGITKPLGKQLFYRHADTLLGRRVPNHIKQRSKITHLMFNDLSWNMGGVTDTRTYSVG